MKIGIIGYGIVGATLAYNLAKHPENTLDIYDVDYGQGTKAAVGIICPWVSQRRNMTWYEMASQGARYLVVLENELGSSFLRKNGMLMVHQNLERFEILANQRFHKQPEIGQPEILSANRVKGLLPKEITINSDALFIPGGMQIDGKTYIDLLKERTRMSYIPHTAELDGKRINGIEYDVICVCAGAKLSDVFHGYDVDVRAQKGQLVELSYQSSNANAPIIMPQGELDILMNHEAIIIGATHEDTFNSLDVDSAQVERIILEAGEWVDTQDLEILRTRVGLRGVTSDHNPFVERVEAGVYAVGGLGSSGLTTGPILGKRLADHVMDIESCEWLTENHYIKRK